MPAISKEKSRIRMVALTLHGFDNVTWYSYEKENKKRSELICSGMLERFKRHRMFCVTRVIQFWEYGIKIHEVRIR